MKQLPPEPGLDDLYRDAQGMLYIVRKVEHDAGGYVVTLATEQQMHQQQGQTLAPMDRVTFEVFALEKGLRPASDPQ